MLQKYESVFNKTPINITDVFQNQELVFYTFLGVFPSREVRTLSPFRKDNSPNCRFEFFDSLWWFVDNATYKNKLYFNCIELVMYLHDINFKEALSLINSRINIKKEPVINSNPIFDTKEKYKIKIKITYRPWNKSNYYTDNYFIKPDYLQQQPYYNIDDYWVSNKESPILIKNKFGLPKNRIAYHFLSGNIKLYFPDSDLIKWYANTNQYDLFGEHRIGEYYFNPNKELFIASSGKDEMMINYYLEGNSIGLQSETITQLPESILWKIKWFNPIYIWLDADMTGINSANKLFYYLKNIFPTKEIYVIYHNKKLGKDISDIINLNAVNEYTAKRKINEIWKNLKREIGY